MSHKITIGPIELVQTCGACPEQYDAYMGAERVAYLRLRHGTFYAAVPWVGGEVVYESEPSGDGEFTDAERMPELTKAVDAILAHLNK